MVLTTIRIHTIMYLMYICVCKAVTDSQIHLEVRRGHDSLDCIQERLGVGMVCGKCAMVANDVILKARNEFDTQGQIKDTAS